MMVQHRLQHNKVLQVGSPHSLLLLLLLLLLILLVRLLGSSSHSLSPAFHLHRCEWIEPNYGRKNVIEGQDIFALNGLTKDNIAYEYSFLTTPFFENSGTGCSRHPGESFDLGASCRG